MHPDLIRLAGALSGAREAMRGLCIATGAPAEALARVHRVGPLLALQATRLGIDGPEVNAWRAQLHAWTARAAILERSQASLRGALANAGIAWAPLKGVSLGRWLYELPAARPTTDLDILIRMQDLASAREHLVAVGWTGCGSGPEHERYLQDEGYNWKAVDRLGVPLELHYRLWGSVPGVLGEVMLDRSLPDPSNGTAARRLDPADELVVAAAHLWLTAPPRPLLYLCDIKLLLDHGPADIVAAAADRSRAHGLELQVSTAATLVARLWSHDRSRELAELTAAGLRPSERLARAVVLRRGDLDAPTALLVAARLVAGRPSRSGLRLVLRALRPHPGITTHRGA